MEEVRVCGDVPGSDQDPEGFLFVLFFLNFHHFSLTLSLATRLTFDLQICSLIDPLLTGLLQVIELFSVSASLEDRGVKGGQEGGFWEFEVQTI